METIEELYMDVESNEELKTKGRQNACVIRTAQWWHTKN